MGLTLHYKLRAPASLADGDVPRLVAAMHRLARRFQQAGRAAAVSDIGSAPKDFLWLSEYLMVRTPGDPDTRRGVEVPVQAGRVFTVTLGAESEPLRLGLCRYPERVMDRHTGRPRIVRRRGWRLQGFCKTQYASLHGWEHFRRCHTAAVDLLAGLRELGLRVTVNDEGGYWPHRDETELRRSVDRMNGIVAAFAGALKDVTDGDGGPAVQSPIFAHPQFERLEAEGVNREGSSVAAAVELVRKQPHPRR
jgi:hypothetical protein